MSRELACFRTLLITTALLLIGCSAFSENSSRNPVTTPNDEQVGESELERDAAKIALNIEACCVTAGNAYTAWWVLGDVTTPMSAAETKLAQGWIAEGEQVSLTLELAVGGDSVENALDGVRVVVLDHGPDTGDPRQLTTPEGGCSGGMMCPVILSTSHAGTGDGSSVASEQ